MDAASLKRIKEAALSNLLEEIRAILIAFKLTGKFDSNRVDETLRKMEQYEKITKDE